MHIKISLKTTNQTQPCQTTNTLINVYLLNQQVFYLVVHVSVTKANVANKKIENPCKDLSDLLFCNACTLHSPCKTFYFFCYIYLWVFSNSYEVSKVQNHIVLHCTKETFMILFYILRKVLSVLAVLLLVQLNFEYNLTPFKYEERMFYR